MEAVSGGGAFGEVIYVSQTSKTPLSYLGSLGRNPQIDSKNQDGFASQEFNAPLERGGIYPITISSRVGYVGMPVMLTVEAGIPLVYRLDGGDVKTHSGEKALILGPISANLGYTELRLAAYNSSQSVQNFRASLKIVDLKGAWTLQSTTGTPNTDVVICDNPPLKGSDKLYTALPTYGNLFMAMGDFTPAGSADKLDWTFLPKRLPSGTSPGGFAQNYSMEITPEDITIKGRLDIPQKKAFIPSAGKTAGSLGALSLLVVGMVGGKRLTRLRTGGLRKIAITVIVLLLVLLLLAGCATFYGSSDVEIKISKLEASNGDTDATWDIATQRVPGTLPIWTITEASGTYTVDSTTVTDTTPDLLADQKINSYNRCTGTLIFDLKGGVYPDVTITNSKQE